MGILSNHEHGYDRRLFDTVPSIILVMDRDLRVREANRAARELLAPDDKLLLKRLCGDILSCFHSAERPHRCGTTPNCRTCVIRNVVQETCDGHHVHRRITRMIRKDDNGERPAWFLITSSPFPHRQDTLALVIMEDVTELAELRRIIPICCHCHKVRDDDRLWRAAEDYLTRHTGIEFSHGICPECMREHYPELIDDDA